MSVVKYSCTACRRGLLEMLLKILDNGLKYWDLGSEMVYYRNLRY